MTCSQIALLLGTVLIPCSLAGAVIGFRIGARRWPWGEEQS